ncbi:hypothetical protein DFH08DRAFT_950942 [Mycena albidolilacea]|uniref:Uncharacterized protein n=1 Tax=Mycena albidolilacea TaxID=1033008 RepID=A0AAD7AMB5_9AGAR|nr:hypothetical protein DFH08DRAFT_950942 [Mycena albidolilacea]
MHLIHCVPFTPEIESFRQLIFETLTRGLGDLLDVLRPMVLELPEAYNICGDDVDEGSKERGPSLAS